MKLEKQITFLLLLLFSLNSYGQKFLALDKRGKVKRIRFYKGDSITLKTKSDSLISGIIQLFEDSSFWVSGQPVVLSDIKSIQSPKNNSGLKLISNLSFLAGSGYFILDSGNRLLNNEKPFVEKSTVKTSAIFIGIAIFSFSVSKRSYQINNRHPLKIIDISIN